MLATSPIVIATVSVVTVRFATSISFLSITPPLVYRSALTSRIADYTKAYADRFAVSRQMGSVSSRTAVMLQGAEAQTDVKPEIAMISPR